MSRPGDHAAWLRELAADGWVITPASRGRLKLTHPDARIVVTAPAEPTGDPEALERARLLISRARPAPTPQQRAARPQPARVTMSGGPPEPPADWVRPVKLDLTRPQYDPEGWRQDVAHAVARFRAGIAR